MKNGNQKIPTGYKQTEIGVIPVDWDVKKLKDIAPLQRGFDLPTPQLQAGSFPVVYSNGILNFHNVAMVKAPGVVTGRSGTIGKVNYIEKDYWPHNTTLWVTDFKGNDEKYIYFLYSFLKFERLGTGSGVPTLNRNDVHDFRVGIPKIKKEQIAIAVALSDTDVLIEKLETLLEKKKNIKQGAMQELLTGKRRLPGFSGEWKTIKLGELGTFYKGRGISSRDLVQDGLPCIMYGDIYVKFNTKFSNPDYRITEATAAKSSMAKTGDLFFTSSGETAEEIGKCIVYLGQENIYIGGDIIGMTPNQDIDSLFLAYSQSTAALLSQKANLGQGHTVVHIYTEHIKSLNLYLPLTKNEQVAIATVLSEMDAEIQQLESQLTKYQNLKQGMMQVLLTGKIRLI